jgi:hypothetical protein
MRLTFRFGFDITSVVEIRHPYKYIQESRFSARGGADTTTNYMLLLVQKGIWSRAAYSL